MHICSLGPKLQQQNFSNPSVIYTQCCAQTFPPIFLIFAIFDRNFAKIVAPPSNGNENCVMQLKEQSLQKKRSLLCRNRPMKGNVMLVRTMHPSNARCSELVERKKTKTKTKTKQKQLETKASSHEGQCIPAGYCHAHMLLYASGLITM